MQNDVLANTNKRQRILMASKGENIEALIAKNEPEVIAKLIDYQYAKEHYEEWKSHEHGDVRYALACLVSSPKHSSTTKIQKFVKLSYAIIPNISDNYLPEIKSVTGNSFALLSTQKLTQNISRNSSTRKFQKLSIKTSSALFACITPQKLPSQT